MDMVMSLGSEKPVVIFSKSSCCMSHSIQKLISSYGANPEVHELDKVPSGKEMESACKLLGQSAETSSTAHVPAVFIGHQFVGGANEVMSLHIQGKLAPLLIQAKAIWVWKG
ncbi:monothiol glutaredoxin-S2-like [Malania oleifera]|uniref:monothiol glutaredoxin-S2-like n=1 Tax=Malania oleifera TaxID=397392 RepID=UPI0025AE6651|nr:monothiol glutaredoxin-S2-like [Malania oleifera]